MFRKKVINLIFILIYNGTKIQLEKKTNIFFENMTLTLIRLSKTECISNFIYRFEGTKSQFNILKQSIICALDLISDPNSAISVKGRIYNSFNTKKKG